MQDLLNDIELDVRELKYLVQAIAGGADPALRRVACRNIGQLKSRLDALRRQLEAAQPPVEAPQPPAAGPTVCAAETTAPVAETPLPADEAAALAAETPQPAAASEASVAETPQPQPVDKPVPPVAGASDLSAGKPQPVGELVSVPPVVEEASVPDARPSVSAASPAAAPILAERIRPATDLRHAISLNDSFRFTRELFGGDAARMNDVLRRLGEAPALDEALAIFEAEVHVEEDNPAAADFVELLRKYFN